MQSGMMWFDDSKKSLAEKIKAASAYYRKKYGTSPDTCMINPKALDDPLKKVGRITIKESQHILTKCLWIGKGKSEK